MREWIFASHSTVATLGSQKTCANTESNRTTPFKVGQDMSRGVDGFRSHLDKDDRMTHKGCKTKHKPEIGDIGGHRQKNINFVRNSGFGLLSLNPSLSPSPSIFFLSMITYYTSLGLFPKCSIEWSHPFGLIAQIYSK